MAESILHGLVATGIVMLVLGGGGIRDPRSRLRFWLVALAGPVVLGPLLQWLAPWRASEDFRDGWALLSGERLAQVGGPGLRPATVAALGLAAAGLLLYLRDLLPFLLDLRRGGRHAATVAAVPERLATALAEAARALGTQVPRVRLVESRHPILICRGLRRPVVFTSTGLLERLTGHELDAAVAHELAHARHRDPALGWLLMVVRGAFWFNPAVQLCARAATHELERRADRVAAEAVGDPELVAGSLRRLAEGDGERTAAAGWRSLRAWHGFRLAAIGERCRALLDRRPPPAAPGWTLVATALGLGVILFLTVA